MKKTQNQSGKGVSKPGLVIHPRRPVCWNWAELKGFVVGFLIVAILFGALAIKSISSSIESQGGDYLTTEQDNSIVGLASLAISWSSIFFLIIFLRRMYLKRSDEKWLGIMRSAASLEKALELGFDSLPLGMRMIGPKGKIVLERNLLPKGHSYVAEIAVIDAESINGKIVLTAAWPKEAEYYHLQDGWPGNIKEWSGRW
jgi:hypothetical protein